MTVTDTALDPIEPEPSLALGTITGGHTAMPNTVLQATSSRQWRGTTATFVLAHQVLQAPVAVLQHTM
jgi:hypothetical protein